MAIFWISCIFSILWLFYYINKLNNHFGLYDTDYYYGAIITYIIGLLIITSLLFIIFSMFKGILYEKKVQKLHIGMTMQQVENLYGTGTSGLGLGSKGSGSADCFKCQGTSYQFSYRLNGNFWYSDLEDNYYVCYINDIVCDFDRIGL